MKIGECGLCLSKNVRLVDSHIFPAWMGRAIRAEGPLLSVPTSAQSEPSFVFRHGVYDQIVCDSCEKSFGAADTYFSRFYAKKDQCKICRARDGNAHVFSGWDQRLIQIFFLQCIFRSHLSTRPMYASFSLGKYEAEIRGVLVSRPKAVMPRYDVLLFRQNHVLSEAIVPPVKSRMGSVNVARMHVPGFGAIVKLDQRRLPGFAPNFVLGAQKDIWMVEFTEMLPDVLSAVVTTQKLYGDRIDRMVDSQVGKKPRPNGRGSAL